MKNNKAFNIHKNVKKKEMVFEYGLLCFIVLFFVYLIMCAFSIWPSITKSVNITAIASACVALFALTWQLHTVIKARKVLVSLGLNASVHGNEVFISASVTNAGTKSIYPLMTNLYIMEGVEKLLPDGTKSVLFPPVTEHEYNKLGNGECFDCPVRKQCKKEEAKLGENEESIAFPVVKDVEFINTTKIAYNLRLLSYHSLIHIMPNETFAEEVVFSLPKAGYYRIFMIYTDKEWQDCICRSCAVKI